MYVKTHPPTHSGSGSCQKWVHCTRVHSQPWAQHLSVNSEPKLPRECVCVSLSWRKKSYENRQAVVHTGQQTNKAIMYFTCVDLIVFSLILFPCVYLVCVCVCVCLCVCVCDSVCLHVRVGVHVRLKVTESGVNRG